MRRGRWMLAWLCLGMAAPTAACSTHAPPRLERDQVRVWTCPWPGNALAAFTAVTVVRSSLAGLVNLLLDTAAAPRWVYRTERLELLRRDDGLQTFTVRAETDFWPLQDRDVVVDGRIWQDPHTLVVSVESRSSSRFPPRPEFVRMPSMWGRWDFRPLGHGLVEVTMSGHADPGGHIPGFLVNLVVQETPYRTLLGLRRLIGEPRYQQRSLEGIREPTPDLASGRRGPPATRAEAPDSPAPVPGF